MKKLTEKMEAYKANYPKEWKKLFDLNTELHMVDDEEREDEIIDEIADYMTKFAKKHGQEEAHIMNGLMAHLFY